MPEHRAYPGDYPTMPTVSYAPIDDAQPDPGEVAWAWIAYEDDPTRGKTRPSMIIGRDDAWLLGLPMTSKDHDRDEAQEARENRFWYDIGTGPWDREGRSSEVRLNRIVRIHPDDVVHRSARIDRAIFDAVITAMRSYY